MCNVCQARTSAEHEEWLIDFYNGRRVMWQGRGKDFVEATKLAMLDVENLGIEK